MVKKLYLVVAISIIVIISSVGLMILYNPEKVEYTYKVEIHSPSVDPYILIVPIPINRDGSASAIIEDIQVTKGNGTFTTVRTDHGYGLIISGKGDVLLEAIGNDLEGKIPYKLSMYFENKTQAGFWVYSNTTNEYVTVDIDFNILSKTESIIPIVASSCWYHGHGSGNVKEGWNLVEGRVEGAIAD